MSLRAASGTPGAGAPGPRHTIEEGMFVRSRRRPGPGPVVVYLHGLGESGLCFERFAERAELARWPYLIPDLPGYGRSAWPGEPRGLAAEADRVAEWLRGRGETPVVLVGHSMGGVLALLVAERHPQRVLALVDIDGNKSLADCSFSGPAAARSEAAFRDRGFDGIRDRVYRAGVAAPALRGYHASLLLADPRTFHRHAGELVALSRDGRLAERLKGLPVPHLYIAGIPDGVSEESLALLDAADVAWLGVGPSGHWPFIDQPETTADLLARLLRGLRS